MYGAAGQLPFNRLSLTHSPECEDRGNMLDIAIIGTVGGISPSSTEGLRYAFRSTQMLAEIPHADLEDFERR